MTGFLQQEPIVVDYRNVVKLAFNPNKASRDDLYTAAINPVVAFPGSGPILFGDKTALASPSCI